MEFCQSGESNIVVILFCVGSLGGVEFSQFGESRCYWESIQ